MSVVFDVESYQFDIGEFESGVKSGLKLPLQELMGVQTI